MIFSFTSLFLTKIPFSLSQKLVRSIHEYIDEHYVEEAEIIFQRDRSEVYEEIKLIQEADDSLQENMSGIENIINQPLKSTG